MKLPETLISLALLASASARADVLVVDAAGGGDFLDLPEAVDAAQHGDTLLMRTGPYSAPPLVDKGLRIVADSPSDVRVYGQIEVTGILPTQPLLFSGLVLLGVEDTENFPWTTVHVVDAPGPVRFDGCTIVGFDAEPFDSGGSAVIVTDSPDVALIRCELRGGDGGESCNSWPTDAGSGLVAWNSTVTLFRSLAYGGDGGYGAATECAGGYPGFGAWVADGSTVFSVYNYFEGGDGGGSDDFLYSCQWGGDGVFVEAGAHFHEQASVFVGGEGGFTPPNDKCPDGEGTGGPGDVHVISGSPRSLLAPRVVREGESYELEVFGLPGDRAFLFWSPSTGTAFKPAQFGVWLLAGPSYGQLQALGTIDSSGTLLVPRKQSELGPGIEARLLYAQVVVRDAFGSSRLGSPVPIQALDASF